VLLSLPVDSIAGAFAVAGSVVAGSVVAGSVVAGSVVAGSVVTGSVVACSVVVGLVVVDTKRTLTVRFQGRGDSSSPLSLG
jgi:hypothetical protein